VALSLLLPVVTLSSAAAKQSKAKESKAKQSKAKRYLKL